MTADESTIRWGEFFKATADRGPRDMMLLALKHAATTGHGLDLGCGVGNDVVAMLEHGLHVTAVDFQDEAIQRTREKAEQRELDSRLECRVASFDELTLEPSTYDLIHAGFSLPFCSVELFPLFWSQIVDALRPDGIFAGQLFGDRDEWAGNEEHSTKVFLKRDEVDRMIGGFEILHFQEEERDGETAMKTPKHWHVYHFALRKRR